MTKSNENMFSKLGMSLEADMILGRNTVDPFSIKLKDLEKKPCPFCGGAGVYHDEVKYSHGDSTFKGRISCEDCGLTDGEVGGWGVTTPESEYEAWLIWNDRSPEKVITISISLEELKLIKKHKTL